MKIINQAKQSFNDEIQKLAENNIIRKLEKQGIDYTELSPYDFEELVEDEAKILESDSKKVGVGIGIGLAISLLTGF